MSMTEQEYINATDLAKVRAIMAILREIVVANSIGAIQKDYIEVHQRLDAWHAALTDRVKVE